MKALFASLITLAMGFSLLLGAQSGDKNGEIRVKLMHVHMCCDGCSSEVEDILQKVPGIKAVSCEQEANTAQFTANNAAAAQKALDELASKGFHGATGSTAYAFKNDSGVKRGKVTSLTLTDFHNSCGGCVVSFRKAIKNVEGVTGDNLKSKVTTCTITGNFDAAQLVEAINEGGFHVHVKN